MKTCDALAQGAEVIGLREAKILLAHVTGQSVSEIVLHREDAVSADDVAAYIDMVRRRKDGEPLQYILGEWEFMGVPILTDARALIPRPETELLVEEALRYMGELCENGRIADVCTGSGCIAIAMAQRSNAEIIGADISADALSLARENAKKNRVDGRITFVKTDLLDGISGEFDAIISNPPYIPSREMETLSVAVHGYEPHLALDGGPDGCEIYRRLIPQAMNSLRPGGVLFLEIGPPDVEEILIRTGFKNVKLLRDYANLPRIIIGEKPECLTN